MGGLLLLPAMHFRIIRNFNQKVRNCFVCCLWGMGGLLFVGYGLSGMLLCGLGGLGLTVQKIKKKREYYCVVSMRGMCGLVFIFL